MKEVRLKLYTEKPRIRICFGSYWNRQNSQPGLEKSNDDCHLGITLEALNKSASVWLQRGNCMHRNLPYPCYGLNYKLDERN